MARSLTLAQSVVNAVWYAAGRIRSASSDYAPFWTADDPPAWIRSGVAGGRSSSGVLVNDRTAIRNPAVVTAIRVLSEDIAKLPIEMFRKDDAGSKKLLLDHPVTRLLTLQPNRWMTPFEFKEFMVAQLMLNGNAIAIIRREFRNNTGRPIELIPIETPRVTLHVNGSELFYFVSANEYQQSIMPEPLSGAFFQPEDVLHVRGLSLDGLWGLSFIERCKEAIGGAIAVEQYANTLFANNCDAGGVLETEGVLSEEAYQKLKAQFDTRYAGIHNRGRTVILEQGLKFNKLSMTSEQSQYIEVRKYITEDIARIWRIPQHKLGILDRTTHSNVEEQERSYFDTTISPILQRFEEAYRRSLLSSDLERRRIEIQHNIEYFTRARASERWEIYSKALQNGVMTINEVRAKEGLDPRADGDVYLLPVNMMIGGPDAKTLKLVGPPQKEPAPQPAERDDGEEEVPTRRANGNGSANGTSSPNDPAFEGKFWS